MIFIVLIGSEVYAIVTYLLSETWTMAIVTAAQAHKCHINIQVNLFRGITVHIYYWNYSRTCIWCEHAVKEPTLNLYDCLICRTLDERLEGQQGSENTSNMGCSKKVGIVHYSMHWIIELFSSLCWSSVLSDIPPGCCCFLWHIS